MGKVAEKTNKSDLNSLAPSITQPPSLTHPLSPLSIFSSPLFEVQHQQHETEPADSDEQIVY